MAQRGNASARRAQPVNLIYHFPDHIEMEISNIHHPEPVRFSCDLDLEPLLHRYRFYLSPDGYVGVMIDGKMRLLHRLLFELPANISEAIAADGRLMLGGGRLAIGEGMTVDHIDRNRLNNRRSNLRLASKRTQSINKLGKVSKELPPGVQLCHGHDYRVTWSDLSVASGEAAASAADGLSFAASKYGRRGALKAAMTARMLKMISSTDYVTALFRIEVVNRALAEAGAPLLPTIGGGAGGGAGEVDAKAVSVALGTLRELGYNLWLIPYNGQFAHYMEKEDWTFSDTRRYALKSLATLLDWLESTLSSPSAADGGNGSGDEELRRECLRLECDMRALSYLYTVHRRREGQRRKEIAPGLGQLFDRIDGALQSVRSETMPSAAVTPTSARPSDIRPVIRRAEEKMRAVESGDRETVRAIACDTALPSPIAANASIASATAASASASASVARVVAEEAEETAAAALAAAMKGVKDGKEAAVQQVMHSALLALQRASEPKPASKPRTYSVSTATTAWVSEHVTRVEGHATLSTDLIEAYEQWMSCNGHGTCDGKTKLYYALRQAGYQSSSRPVFLDCSLQRP